MMDTVLNLGLNDDTVEGLVAASGDARFAWDSYRRFIQMYGRSCSAWTTTASRRSSSTSSSTRGKIEDTELTAADWHRVVDGYKEMVAEVTGKPFPQDPWEQLWGAIGAVFGSWQNQRAITYRRLHDIPAEWGTAVNVQAMVFGNMGEDCATGVVLHPRPVHRREHLLRRIPDQRAGRGRGGRHPHAAADGRAEGQARRAQHGRGDARRLCRAGEGARDARAPLPDMQDIEFTVQRTSCTCCRRATGSAPRRPPQDRRGHGAAKG